MKTIQKLIPLVLITLITFVSCEREENISDIPQIGFKSLDGPFLIQQGTITSYGAELVFEFRDGDSDFGVDMTERPQDSINLYMLAFQKINGIYDSIDFNLYGRKYTIKKDDKLDREGSVKGEIKVLVTYVIKPPFDTIRYDFYILDRAGNKSNIESTSDISY